MNTEQFSFGVIENVLLCSILAESQQQNSY